MYPCQRIRGCYSRRQMLQQAACGFGALGLAALMHKTGMASQGQLNSLHHEPRAKRVIFLYMDGGPAQMDTFDPKPMLSKYHGKPFPMKAEPTQFDNNGSTLESPWKFARMATVACGLVPCFRIWPNMRTDWLWCGV